MFNSFIIIIILLLIYNVKYLIEYLSCLKEKYKQKSLPHHYLFF
jgi:hypothetical protein